LLFHCQTALKSFTLTNCCQFASTKEKTVTKTLYTLLVVLLSSAFLQLPPSEPDLNKVAKIIGKYKKDIALAEGELVFAKNNVDLAIEMAQFCPATKNMVFAWLGVQNPLWAGWGYFRRRSHSGFCIFFRTCYRSRQRNRHIFHPK
jgi:hypothetical protein